MDGFMDGGMIKWVDGILDGFMDEGMIKWMDGISLGNTIFHA